MTQTQQHLELNIGTSANFLEQILTKDVSTLEAIYDLIDNSIDAARNSIFEKKEAALDQFGLPTSYKGYSVDIEINADYFSIEDNCFGISEEMLVNKTFVIAESSNHNYGIGQYGIGLKRSLLKMGNQYSFEIDNSNNKYSAKFNNEYFGLNKKIITDVNTTSGSTYTLFTVTNLKEEVQKDIQNERWLKNAIKGLQDRYSIYFSKGFVINLKYFGEAANLTLIQTVPNLRTDGKFLPTNKQLTFPNVTVIIESGIHENYYFPTEKKHSISINRQLTKDFGIYFICNDRVIVSSSTELKHGWETKWHSEYNGFVCLVKFISKDPSNLPWNTAKTAMREDASLFLDVIEHIQPIASTYRSEIKNRYENKKKDKKLVITGKEPVNTSKEPVNTSKEPVNTGKEPVNTSKEPENTGKDSTDEKEILKEPQYDKKIIECQDLVKMINKLNIPKFNSLYKSLLDIIPEQHPLLTVVGIWSFFDSLARIDPSYSGEQFQGYYNGRLNGYDIDKNELKFLKKQIEWFMHEGNFNKHNQDYATLNGLDIVYKFNKVQPLIAFVIEKHILPTLKST